jgi:hypothetical protein
LITLANVSGSCVCDHTNTAVTHHPHASPPSTIIYLTFGAPGISNDIHVRIYQFFTPRPSGNESGGWRLSARDRPTAVFCIAHSIICFAICFILLFEYLFLREESPWRIRGPVFVSFRVFFFSVLFCFPRSLGPPHAASASCREIALFNQVSYIKPLLLHCFRDATKHRVLAVVDPRAPLPLFVFLMPPFPSV